VAGAVLLPQGQHPGCTTEGIDFNALLPKFKKAGAVVLGVSRDSVKSHDNFCAKQGFRFPLVSDGDEALCSAFDVIKMKNMYGKQVRGIERSTFLISPDSRIVQSWRKVKVAGHADAVLAELKASQSK
jgi:peroxiredoxin Q/BCP